MKKYIHSMSKTKSLLLGAAALAFTALPSQAVIVVGDFSSDYDGWQLVGDGNNLQYYSSERVEAGGVWYLRNNYSQDNEGNYPGWTGLSSTWDSTGQENVTELTFTMTSAYPWKVELLATFAGVGEVGGGAIFWPGNPTPQTYTFTVANFGGVTAEQFNGIQGLRIVMDASSATNGGSGNPMSFQIANVELNGTAIPEPQTVALLIGGITFALYIGRRRFVS